jgi:hypothetical protein
MKAIVFDSTDFRSSYRFFRMWSGGQALLTAEYGSYLITFCDIVVCIVFISMWRMFKKNIKEYEKKGSGNNVTTRNYAVHVRGLPIEATGT